VKALGETQTVEQYEKIDSINALVSGLQRLWRGREERFVLVLDGIDKQRGASSTLLPALARVGDVVC
jgi:origin recognition complex subunit 5